MFKLMTMKLFVFRMIYDQNQSNHLEQLRLFSKCQKCHLHPRSMDPSCLLDPNIALFGLEGGLTMLSIRYCKATICYYNAKNRKIWSGPLNHSLKWLRSQWGNLIGKDVFSTSFGCFSMNFCAPWVCDKRNYWCFKLMHNRTVWWRIFTWAHGVDPPKPSFATALSPFWTKEFLTRASTTTKHHAEHTRHTFATCAYQIFAMAKDNVLKSLLILQTVHLKKLISFGNWIWTWWYI